VQEGLFLFAIISLSKPKQGNQLSLYDGIFTRNFDNFTLQQKQFLVKIPITATTQLLALAFLGNW
jgi:hypothetical protein